MVAIDVPSLETGIGSRVIDLQSAQLLNQIEVVGSREGGLIDCWVPSELIDHEEVPVKEEWAQSLARQMKDLAAVHGGTGQNAAILLGLIEGENKFRIIDGFHRDAALEINKESTRYATIRHTDWDGLYDFRIFTAKDHAHVRFSRVVQWIREIWAHSGLDQKMSVEQAVLLYRFDTDGSKLKLDPEDVATAKAWIARKEGQWQMAAMTIHAHLKVAAHVDPTLVHSTREKTNGKSLEAPTLQIVTIFSNELPDNFELQNLVMDVAKERNLKGPEVKALCKGVKDCDNLEAAQKFIKQIDWQTWKPEYGETKERALRRAYDPRHKGSAVLTKSELEISSISDRVRQAIERGEEVTPEMAINVKAAQLRAKKLARELMDLCGQFDGLLTIVSDETSEDKPKIEPVPAIPKPQSVPTTSVNSTPHSKPVAAEPKPQKSQSDEKVFLNRHSPGERVVQRKVVKKLEPVTPGAGESLAAANFKHTLRAFLTGQIEEMPEITTRMHLSWAEKVLLEGLNGDVDLDEAVRESMQVAREEIHDRKLR